MNDILDDGLFILLPSTSNRLPEELHGDTIQRLFDLGVNATAFFIPSQDLADIYEEFKLHPPNDPQVAHQDFLKQLKEQVPAAHNALFPKKPEPAPLPLLSSSENDETEEDGQDSDSGAGADRSLSLTPSLKPTKLKRSKAQSSSLLDHSQTRSQQQLHEDLEQKQLKEEEAATKLKPAYRPRQRDDGGLER